MPLPSWSCVNSFIRSPINILWPLSMRPHYVRRIAAMPPLHDLKTILTSTTLTGMSLSHLYNEVSVLRVRSRCRTPRLVQPLPMFSSLAQNCTRIPLRQTHANWMWLVTIFLVEWALACNFETYRYSIPSAHMPFLILYIYNFFTLASDIMKSTITTSASSHIQLILHLSIFFSLSSNRPFSVRVDCTDIYTYFAFPQPCTPQVDE